MQFNLASAGSIIIQLIIAFLGEKLIGLYDLFTMPVLNFTVKTGTIYAVIGILIGMVWNFFAYTKFIWKSK
jgi:putative flippase GtrA